MHQVDSLETIGVRFALRILHLGAHTARWFIVLRFAFPDLLCPWTPSEHVVYMTSLRSTDIAHRSNGCQAEEDALTVWFGDALHFLVWSIAQVSHVKVDS